MTLIVTFAAFRTIVDKNFLNTLPSNHEYIKTLIRNEREFNFQNQFFVFLKQKNGDIFNENYFKKLKSITDKIFFYPDIDRVTVTSLTTPNSLYLELVEDGLLGGTIFPNNFDYSEKGFQLIKTNIIKSGLVGMLVSQDFNGSIIKAKFNSNGSGKNESLKLLSFPSELENELTQEARKGNLELYILGLPKLVKELNKGYIFFIVVTCIVIILMFLLILLVLRSFALTRFAFTYSILCMIWHLGLMSVLNLPISIFSVQLTTICFTISLINILVAIKQNKFILNNFLLLSVAMGSIPLCLFPIRIFSDASIIMGTFCLSIFLCNTFAFSYMYNLVNKASVLIFIGPDLNFSPHSLLSKKNLFLIMISLILIYASFARHQLVVGVTQSGATELSTTSIYNQDLNYFTKHFLINPNVLTIFFNGQKDACVDSNIIQVMEDLEWKLRKIKGVNSILGVSYIMKHLQVVLNGGNLKWFGMPNNRSSFKQVLSEIDSSSGLFNFDCSIMPLLVFLDNTSSDYINEVVSVGERFIKESKLPAHSFINIGGGDIGVLAAQNDVVRDNIIKIFLLLFTSLIILILVFSPGLLEAFKAILFIIATGYLALLLMSIFSIGLTPSSLSSLSLGLGLSVGLTIFLFKSKDLYIFVLAIILLGLSIVPLITSGITMQSELGFPLIFLLFSLLAVVVLNSFSKSIQKVVE